MIQLNVYIFIYIEFSWFSEQVVFVWTVWNVTVRLAAKQLLFEREFFFSYISIADSLSLSVHPISSSYQRADRERKREKTGGEVAPGGRRTQGNYFGTRWSGTEASAHYLVYVRMFPSTTTTTSSTLLVNVYGVLRVYTRPSWNQLTASPFTDFYFIFVMCFIKQTPSSILERKKRLLKKI